MKKVVCINDKRLPEGAEVVEGKEYVVIESYVNDYDQIAYIIAGISNQGMTKKGLRWVGYDSSRFTELECFEIE